VRSRPVPIRNPAFDVLLDPATVQEHAGAQVASLARVPPAGSEQGRGTFISINWRGRPLRTYEIVVNLIANTTNRGGCWHGDWNYVIRPRKKS
jgi:hypothetical protein